MSLEDRVLALEAADEAVTNVHINGSYCDAGPYDVDGLLGLWHKEGVFTSDSTRFAGHDGLRQFYTSLAAEFGVHMFFNVAVNEMSPQEVSLCCHGLEFPVFGGMSLLGLFSHEVVCDVDDGDVHWRDWRQSIERLCEFEKGWEAGPPVVDQTKTASLSGERT